MSFVFCRNQTYDFNRRVPQGMRKYDPRKMVRISLKTDSLKQARKEAMALNKRLEDYWKQLIDQDQTFDDAKFKITVNICENYGFVYNPAPVVAKASLPEIISRLDALKVWSRRMSRRF